MANREPFAPGEWYHCYSRGIEKRKVFLDKKDYERFLLYMHVANGRSSVHVSNISKGNKSLKDLLAKDFQDKPLVEIGAFCIMPNHFHFLLKETENKGLSLFMQKILTGYTMYFNKKYQRSGALFGHTFDSRHVSDDRYFKKVVSYIHLNPAEIEEKDWKIGKGDLKRVDKFIKAYPYSSLSAFENTENILNSLISKSAFETFDSIPKIEELTKDAQEYYQEQSIKVKP